MLSWLQDAIDIIFMQIVSRKDEIDRIFRQIASFRPHKSCKIDKKLINWCILRHIPLYLLTQALDLQHLDLFSPSLPHAEHNEHVRVDWFESKSVNFTIKGYWVYLGFLTLHTLPRCVRMLLARKRLKTKTKSTAIFCRGENLLHFAFCFKSLRSTLRSRTQFEFSDTLGICARIPLITKKCVIYHQVKSLMV